MMSLLDLHAEKKQLWRDGISHIQKWCFVNSVLIPEIKTYFVGKPTFGTCAYYRDNVIHIWPNSCAHVGRTGRQWSYPGYTVDRTPYGVLAHEVGHHSDKQHGRKGGNLSHIWMDETNEKPISGYAPNPNEWYAEMFRLFLTNPNLLEIIRPKMFEKLIRKWPNIVETRNWEEVLSESPRHINAVRNKLKALPKTIVPSGVIAL